MGSSGRVLQVSISAGGVPKLPVGHPVHVGALGLEDDAHREDTVHGGPHRAVALFAIEAIRRVAAEGHPIFPGSCGENLTTEGIELAELPIGTRLAIGDELLLEISAPDNPCSTIRGSFADQRFARISMLTHPTDSRMYARVLRSGLVRRGDPIVVLPPAAESRATELVVLARLDAAHRKSSVAVWRAAGAAGLDLRIVDDGDIAIVAAPVIPGPWLNRGLGFALLPNVADRALDHFRDAGVSGWLELDPDDPVTPAVGPDERVVVHAIEPDRFVDGPTISGLTIRQVDSGEAGSWARTWIANGGGPVDQEPAWIARAPHLARTAHHSLWIAELDGQRVGTGALHVHHKVGWLRAASVAPAARGQGIHRALTVARARAAADAGADLVGAAAPPDSVAERNLRRMGLVPFAARALYAAGALTP